MFKSLAALLGVASTIIHPLMVRANTCTGTDDVLFFAWTVVIEGIPSVDCTQVQSLLVTNVQNEGGCAAITSVNCAQSGEEFTLTFNQSDFCGGGGISDAIGETFINTVVECTGGPV
ncbi:hypothetical protein LTR36_005864 [Oleoguttula mirabilis]|uniref:Uncharacterized protein n=1 Tax=Oleoguttula mirabilis TaxID=1507867 RepID=A0AAV9JE46_9PEZI|nr:hypothetical protein LTR36_005864 [Oleoguttula mirabilis]